MIHDGPTFDAWWLEKLERRTTVDNQTTGGESDAAGDDPRVLLRPSPDRPGAVVPPGIHEAELDDFN